MNGNNCSYSGSHSEDSSVSRTMTMVGTVSYMAPEVVILMGQCKLHKDGYTAAVDFWSLGVLIYKLLVGVEPYRGETFGSICAKLPVYMSIYEYFNEAYAALFGFVDYDVCDGLLTQDTRDILRGLLDLRADTRLGYDSSDLIVSQQILKNHAFFNGIDWGLLEAKQLPPPYIPQGETIPCLRTDTESDQSQNQGLTLPEMLSKCNKQKWCEEFNCSSTRPVSGESHSTGIRINPADQNYFRSWNYAIPSTVE